MFFFPIPLLLPASEKRRTPRSREVWGGELETALKDFLQCAAPSWPLCVHSQPSIIPGPLGSSYKARLLPGPMAKEAFRSLLAVSLTCAS